ncbi:ABC transporter permease [Actibacterium sp. D379-3]
MTTDLIRPRPVRRLRTARTVFALIVREMATTHGRSAGGYLWAVLEPVGGIALLTLIFSLAFSAPPLGQSFPLFYATGFLPFMMYMDLSQKLTVAIRFSKPLLFYPGVSFADALMARFVLNALTQVLVMTIVVAGIVLAFRVNVIFDFPALALGFAMAAALGLGVGTLTCLLVSLFPVWERLWAVANRPLFVVSSIFFVFESVPQPWRGWLWFNPLAHVIGQMRKGIYPTYAGDFISPLYVFGFGGVTLLAGLLFLGRYHRDIING